jgi:pyruvate formate lyase activating enzyme
MGTSLKELLADHTMPSAPELVSDEGDGALRCVACGHRCPIKPGKTGVCRVRFNRDGELRVPAGYVAGAAVDPIEKKPFYHAYPGRNALSFGMLGCDLHCSYCQNWITSQALRDKQARVKPRFTSAAEMVELAREENIPVIVSTYNEPLITADWAMEIFEPAHEAGIVCGFVSNGNATPEVLRYLRPVMDLYKVDLKCFNDRNYRRLGCALQNVLDTIQSLKEMDFWVEIVTLVVPGFNDSAEELTDIAKFIAGVSLNIPWHVTAFHPDYQMTGPPRTPKETLIRAYDIGKEAHLHYVYAGNLAGGVGDREHTFCHSCGEALIYRQGFYVRENYMQADQCPACHTRIPGVWEEQPPQSSAGSGVPLPVM